MNVKKVHSAQQTFDSSKAAYDEWHSAQGVDSESDAPWHRLLKRYLSIDRDLAGKKVLEIGCGRGGFSFWLATRSSNPPTVIGADFSPAAIKKAEAWANEANIKNISWQVQDIQNLDLASESFDTIVSCETIEHVPDPRKALRELTRVLKPGGRLFLTCPNYMNLLGLYRVYLRTRGRRFTEVGQPINQFLLSPLTRYWISREGLKVYAVDGAIHPFPFPGRHDIKMALEHPKAIVKWFALHTMFIATK